MLRTGLKLSFVQLVLRLTIIFKSNNIFIDNFSLFIILKLTKSKRLSKQESKF